MPRLQPTRIVSMNDLRGSRRSWILHSLGLCGITLLVCLSIACSAETPQQEASGEALKVYIDPETGNIVPAPPPDKAQPPKAEQRTGPDEPPRVVPGPGGSEIVIHERSDWPHLKAEKSPDGDIETRHQEGSRE